ncbi:hypothetical protein DOY81_007175 [Sarcophaga bullata]|nr:hypothetical protein DOY81_007175 [Sarcophaga bullata]
MIFSALFVGLALAKSPTVQELCNLAPGTTILKPNTCTDWIKCPSERDSKDMEEGSCVFGLYFNKNSGRCEYKDSVSCPYEAKSKARCDRSNDGAFLADENNCSGYIYCSSGEELKSNCPGGLVFDPVNKACVYKHQYTCPDKKPPTETNALCLSLPDSLFFADKLDCTKYSECKNSAILSHACNSSFAWDYLKGNCLPIDEVECVPHSKKPEPELKVCVDRLGPVADDASCSGYYFCKHVANDTHDRKPEHFTCPAGNFFDSTTLSCRDRVNVKCNLDRCEGMGNKYVNVAGDCRAYVLCKNGMANNKGVCPNGHYFDERTQGCTPQVVSFAACAAK